MQSTAALVVGGCGGGAGQGRGGGRRGEPCGTAWAVDAECVGLAFKSAAPAGRRPGAGQAPIGRRPGADSAWDERPAAPAAMDDHNDTIDEGGKGRLKVFVRLRPQAAATVPADDDAAGAGAGADVGCCHAEGRYLRLEDPSGGFGIEARGRTSEFVFDGVLGGSGGGADAAAAQEEAHETICRPMVDHTMAGYNSCVFAYGQTGSGKTYSMYVAPCVCVALQRLGVCACTRFGMPSMRWHHPRAAD